MWSKIIVFDQPGIEIGLQLVERVIDLLAERDPVELVEHSAMKALADSVRLRALGLGAAVIDVLDREVELVVVAFAAAEFGATVSQHPRQPDAVLVIERQHPIVEDLGRGDRRFAVIEFGEGDLGIGIDEGLLIDPPDAGLSGISCGGWA
jgi:hypothetical protein